MNPSPPLLWGRGNFNCRAMPSGGFSFTMNCLATFRTTSMALMFERACRKAGVKARIAPVPRSLSSSCGLACDFPCESRAEAEAVALRDKIDVAGWHEMPT